ncbi:BrnA antitoxin family protein [Methylobacterium sp. J-090]|uniref:BrnA antitoxin family protein n=1 Tax=Methylobacterium sp. J-090 TaxID=2836666 RepID=UPI001FB8D487|nr:BrnA antitoxin family protein [Methylobacterium sp. J-090]MCJ2082263.1 BrnA antitoxin family protein [Methylobacterium sp. J-090]
MSEKSITHTTLQGRRQGRTDHTALKAVTDETIAERVASDPDAGPLDIDWSKAELVIPQRKAAISIRLDEDVLDFFKRSGAGYQSRINAVLRSYMQAKGGGVG